MESLNNQQPQVTGLGISLLDILLVTKGELEFGEKNSCQLPIYQLGGVVQTALWTLARFGVLCRTLTIVGDDAFGGVVEGFLRKIGFSSIDGIHVASGGKTPFSVVVVEERTGLRTIIHNNDLYTMADASVLKVEIAPTSQLVLIDGHNPDISLEAIRQARKIGAKVFFDVASKKPRTDELLAQSDVVFAPEAFWSKEFPSAKFDEIAKAIFKMGPKIVVITAGENGSYVFDGKDFFHQPAFQVEAVDTNGAGDVFMGGFAYGLLQKWELKRTAEFASAAAALSCTKVGKDASIPKSVTAVLNFLGEKR